ncbi:hypothetical protein PSPO01_10025 [Paraphaeosphaeria sporulosa]
MAALRHAHTQLYPQVHTFSSTPLDVRYSGPYTPISPRHSAHPTRPRKAPPPPVRISQHDIPPTPMSPREHQHTVSPHSPRIAPTNRHRPLSYSPPYTSAPPQTPHYPIMTLQQQQQQYDLSLHPPTPRHHALHYTGPPPRESAEVMLRKLELEEADAKLRASMTQERLQAEIVAKKKAVARALMMEEKGLR